MRKAAFVLLGLVAFLVLASNLLIGWTLVFRPLTRPVTDRKFDSSPERLERGRYIVENLAACIRCHSPNDLRKPLPGTEGSGWILPLPHSNPFKHQIVAPNITPDRDTGIGLWSDDEIGRAVREGVDRKGRSFTYIMPCLQYRKMSDEDLASVVVYLRSLAPVHKSRPTTKLMFPVQFLVRLVPLPITSVVSSDQSSAERRGEYLVALATCNGCHSPHDSTGHLIEGLEFSGGDVLRLDPAPVTVPNITPDETGIKRASAESFREMIRTGQRQGRMLHPVMPYDQYAKLTGADLNDMFAYLRTVRPVKHFVDGTQTATKCRVCKNEHGGGNQN
ncbi:MAG: cytochrome c [Candidatus Solibacter sp.]